MAFNMYFHDQEIATPSLDIYYTEETVVGVWIDGRKIYRKIFETTFGNVNVTKTVTNVATWNIKNVIDIHGVVQNVAYMTVPSITFDGTSWIPTTLVLINKQNNLVVSTSVSAYVGANVIVFVEYTKND